MTDSKLQAILGRVITPEGNKAVVYVNYKDWAKLLTALEESRADLKEAKLNREMADGCLGMIREALEALGTDMKHTPPMMYNDAMRSTIARLREEVRVEYREAANATTQENKRLREALDDMLNWALANRGTKSQFVTCYTYGSDPKTGPRIPDVIKNAESALEAAAKEVEG